MTGFNVGDTINIINNETNNLVGEYVISALDSTAGDNKLSLDSNPLLDGVIDLGFLVARDFRTIIYRVETDAGTGRNELIRDDGTVQSMVVDGITDFQLSYILDDGNEVTAPADLSDVRRIRIDITAATIREAARLAGHQFQDKLHNSSYKKYTIVRDIMARWKTYTLILDDESGTALVIAMVFLGLLTTIGLYALLNSTTELTSSARYRGDKEAFYAAEGALEYVKGDGYYFTTKGTLNIPDNNHPTAAARSLASGGTDATGTIKYLNSGNPPPGYGFSLTTTMSSYFVIEATGTSGSGMQNVQEEGVAKILPKG